MSRNKAERKELINNYKQKIPDAGVYRFLNEKTGKYYLGNTRDIGGLYNKLEFAKNTDSIGALPLVMKQDITVHGIESISIEILEKLDIKPEMTQPEIRRDLKLLEDLWREKLGTENEY